MNGNLILGISICIFILIFAIIILYRKRYLAEIMAKQHKFLFNLEYNEETLKRIEKINVILSTLFILASIIGISLIVVYIIKGE